MWIIIIKTLIIAALVITVFVGINIPLIVFDLILKTIGFVSGSTFFSSIMSGGFSWDSPIFITYMTVFILTLIMTIAYTITYSVKRVYNKIDLDGNKGFTTSDFFKRYKLLIFWIVGFFLVPFLVNLLLIGVSSLASLFGLDVLTNYDKFTKDDTLWYLQKITSDAGVYKNQLNTLLAELEIILKKHTDGTITLAPNDLVELQNQISNIGTSILKLNVLEQEINKLIGEIKIGNSDFVGNISSSINNIITLKNDFINSTNSIKYSILEDIIIKYHTLTPNLFETLLIKSKEFEILVNTGIKVKTDDILSISLNNLSTLNSTSKEYISEKTTQILSNILYGEPTIDPFKPSSSINLGNFIPKLFSLFSKEGLVLIIQTIGLAFTLSTFMNIAINFGKRTFQLLGLVIVSPYFFVSGIKDEGQKLTIWFETVIGKILLIVFVSLSIQIWSILLVGLNEIPEQLIKIYGETEGNFGYMVLKIFIQMILLVSSTYALSEFINYLSEIFKAQDMFQSKNRLYGREFKAGLGGVSTVFDKSKKGINYTRQRFDVNSDLFKAKDKSSFGKYVNAPIKKFKSKKVESK